MKARLALIVGLSLVLVSSMGTGSKAAGAKAWSSHKVAQFVQSKHFKVADIRRKGATYVVVADGPKGNRVLIVVDGKNGKVLGMDVIKWARGAKRVKRGSHGTGFWDEFYEFGVTVPVAVYLTWTDYTVAEWSVSVDYVELSYEEYSEEITTEEVTYEESVEEVTETTTEEEAVETTESSTSEESSSSEESSTESQSDESSDSSDGDSDDEH